LVFLGTQCFWLVASLRVCPMMRKWIFGRPGTLCLFGKTLKDSTFIRLDCDQQCLAALHWSSLTTTLPECRNYTHLMWNSKLINDLEKFLREMFARMTP
jgi:hypothetical protein